jgi:hypothetical protein
MRDHGWRIPERSSISNDMRRSFERLQAMGIGVVLSADEGSDDTVDLCMMDMVAAPHPQPRAVAPHPRPLSHGGARGEVSNDGWSTMKPVVSSDRAALCLPYSKEDLTSFVQAELQHWITPQLRPILRPVIQALSIEPHKDTVYVVCANGTHRSLAETHLLPLVSSILRDFGWPTVPRLIATFRF